MSIVVSSINNLQPTVNASSIDHNSNLMDSIFNSVEASFTDILTKQGEIAPLLENIRSSNSGYSAKNALELQVSMNDYIDKVQATSKIVSGVVKSIDGLVHTQ